MSEEPAPFHMPSAPLPSKTWRQRINSVFTEPVKLPGWAVVILVIVEGVPDWKHRLEFWLDVAKGTGGGIAMAATVIASPYFTPALLAAGLLWIAFAGEAPKGVQRHHWLRYVGWSVFLICFTTIAVTVGFGAIEIYIKQEVGKRDDEIQKQAAIRPVFWHLTDWEKAALEFELNKLNSSQRFEIKIKCLPDAGSRTFVEDLAKVFVDNDWKITANCFFSDLRPDLVGLYVGVSPALKGKTIDELPRNIGAIFKILGAAQIPVQGAALEKDIAKEEDFYLEVGNAP